MAANYDFYVEHPRFGKYPRFTGIDPNPESPDVHLHWHTGYWTKVGLDLLSELSRHQPFLSRFFAEDRSLIFGTAILADPERQTRATVPVTHYYDLDKSCRDCGRRFIFFALEQKYWYEELGFPLESDCVRCHPCRKAKRLIARAKKRYDDLFHQVNRTAEEGMEMVDCCV